MLFRSSEAGKAVCALDAEATKARFASTQDAAKSHNYCGDAAYVAALLSAGHDLENTAHHDQQDQGG